MNGRGYLDRSVIEAMKLIATEGMESPLKARLARKAIDRDSKKFGWTDELISTMDPEWQWRLCCARLQLGYLDWKGWEWRDPRPLRKDLPLWKGGKGKILLHGEQGIGDEIMFSQCIPDLLKSNNEIYLECDDRLKSLFQRSFPEVKVLGRTVDGDFDFRLPIGELPKLYRRDKDSFTKGSYLIPDPEKVEKWSHLKGIGVSWKGRQGFIPYKKLGGDVNLQYNETPPEDLFTPDVDLTNDIEDIFGIISNLDRVVCVPTSVLHFAGSLNVPCDVILCPGTGQVNNALNWRFGMGNKTYWHESVTVHRNIDAYLRHLSKAQRRSA